MPRIRSPRDPRINNRSLRRTKRSQGSGSSRYVSRFILKTSLEENLNETGLMRIFHYTSIHLGISENRFIGTSYIKSIDF